ncbi:MAG: hypothetical protein HYX68_28005 [Planctomycetes bacterium]|jgi:ribonuclease HII|nr:hypothetical protein [Planctomycetota bacterium]
MPWQIGIDEAGYGPNLGPFVMTLVACRVPEVLSGANLWDVLQPCVRRAEDAPDGRLIVADSKQVYTPSSGWRDLETTVLAGLAQSTPTLRNLLDWLATDDIPLLKEEAWFAGDTSVPAEVTTAELFKARTGWRQACESAGVVFGFSQSAIVAAPRFNDLIDRWDSKGAVLSVALTHLMQACLQQTATEPMSFVIDKHGGRNSYAALLQHAFSDGMVLAEQEGRERSVYRVEGLDRPIRITFMPRADGQHFAVALASMISKYVREMLMREFNRYWQTHVPGLKPTAGYPVDAVRFFDAIRPALTKLGITERQVWRCR